jgi:hypothetical protein
MKLTTKQLKQIIRESIDDFYKRMDAQALLCKDLRLEKERFSHEVQNIIEYFWDKSPNTWIRFRAINRSTGVINLQKFRRILPTATDDQIYQAGNFLDQWFAEHCYGYLYYGEN